MASSTSKRWTDCPLQIGTCCGSLDEAARLRFVGSPADHTGLKEQAPVRAPPKRYVAAVRTGDNSSHAGQWIVSLRPGSRHFPRAAGKTGWNGPAKAVYTDGDAEFGRILPHRFLAPVPRMRLEALAKKSRSTTNWPILACSFPTSLSEICGAQVGFRRPSTYSRWRCSSGNQRPALFSIPPHSSR